MRRGLLEVVCEIGDLEDAYGELVGDDMDNPYWKAYEVLNALMERVEAEQKRRNPPPPKQPPTNAQIAAVAQQQAEWEAALDAAAEQAED
jgi:hypothetical protein